MISVVVADDHAVVRAGVRAVLSSEADIRVVAEASRGSEARALVRALRPEVLLLDLTLPDGGVETLRAVRAEHPATQVLVLSMHAAPAQVRPALEAGALGYLVKGAGVEHLVEALRRVAAGQRFLDPEAARALEAPFEPSDDGWGLLTPRERLVLEAVAQGRTNRQIALELDVSPKTVDTHRSNLMRKLGLHDAQAVTRFALRRGLLD